MKVETVLLIDDDEFFRKLGKLSLELIGHWSVTTASSGPSGLELAVSLQPDLILLDVKMPDMDGPTTLAKLRELPECKNIPVIFLTAVDNHEELEKLLSLGVAGALTKPFDHKLLHENIQTIVDQKLGA